MGNEHVIIKWKGEILLAIYIALYVLIGRRSDLN